MLTLVPGVAHHLVMEGAVPFVLTAPWRVAIPLMKSIKAELQRMEKLGMISKIESPTDWCAVMVVVPKPNKCVQICVDLTKQTAIAVTDDIQKSTQKCIEQQYPRSRT